MPACHSLTTRFPTSPDRRAARPAVDLARPELHDLPERPLRSAPAACTEHGITTALHRHRTPATGALTSLSIMHPSV